jgi:hypothetical protein
LSWSDTARARRRFKAAQKQDERVVGLVLASGRVQPVRSESELRVTPLNDRLVTTRSALLLLWVAVGFVVLVARVPCWRGPRLVQGSLAVRTALRPDAWLIQQLAIWPAA